MLRVAWGVWLKDRITVADKVRVYIYSDRAKKAKTNKKRRETHAYLKKIVGVLTGKRFVWLRDVLYLNKLLSLSGMLAKEGEEKRTLDEIRRQIIDLCSDLGSRCGKHPNEIMEEMTDEEIESFTMHLYARYYENALHIAAAHASPVAFGEQMTKRLEEKREEIAAFSGRKQKEDESPKNGLAKMPNARQMMRGMFGGASSIIKREERRDWDE